MRFAALALLVGCSTLPLSQQSAIVGAPAGEHSVFAVPGEKMVYRVKLRGITVGTVRVAIGEPGMFDGKRSIIARTRGETDGMLELLGKVAWECTSTIDLDRGLPIVNREELWAELAGEKEHRADEHRWSEDAHHHDAHSAVGRFRGWRSRFGQRMAFDMRIAHARLDVTARHAGREYLPNAKAHGIRYEGLIAGRFAFAAWVSDDPSRVPLKFQSASKWGAIEVELVEYQTK